MAGEGVEVGVVMKDWGAGADGDGGDETVDQLADGRALSSALAIERGGILIVGRTHWYDHGTSEQAPEVQQMGLVPGSGQHFHPYGVADGDFARQQLVDVNADGEPSVPQELYSG